jgi:hypothetical protein
MSLGRSHLVELAIPAWNLEWRMGQPFGRLVGNSFLAVDYCILETTAVIAVEESQTVLDIGRQSSSVGNVPRVK